MSVPKYSKILIFIILLTFIARFLFALLFVDLKNLEYYEYGNIALNMHHGNGYSLFHYDDVKRRIQV